jgi:hypothetical protein
MSRPSWLQRSALIGAALSCALLAYACRDGSNGDRPSPEGSPRPYMLGFSTLPRELNARSYQEAIQFAGTHGDVVLIQRNVPWSEFAPGGTVGDATAQSTKSERRAVRAEKLKLFYAIDPTDGATGRDRLGGLPQDLTGRRFDDADVRAAFTSYASYVALNYKPDYMALGVEMNLYYEKNRDDWDNFRSLYAEAYAAVKDASPRTQVTVTFQYEDLQGLLPREDAHFAEWQLLRHFDPIDFVAISTYPGFAFDDPTAVPSTYYKQLEAFTDKPIAFAEMGYSSARGTQDLNSGTEQRQVDFLRRALSEAESMPLEFAIWFAIWDPQYAQGTEYAAFESIGLRRADDSEKPAWQVWAQSARRPYEKP